MIRAPPIVAMRPRKKSVESFLAAMNDANSITKEYQEYKIQEEEKFGSPNGRHTLALLPQLVKPDEAEDDETNIDIKAGKSIVHSSPTNRHSLPILGSFKTKNLAQRDINPNSMEGNSPWAAKFQNVKQRREALEKRKVQQKLDNIREKKIRINAFKEKNKTEEVQRGWLKILPLIQCYNRFKNAFYEKELEMENRLELQKRHAAASILQKQSRKRYAAKMKARFVGVSKILVKYEWKARLNLRSTQRQRHAMAIRQFFRDYGQNTKFATIVKSYRYKVILAQRCARDFIAIRKARLYVMGLKWQRVEKDYIKKLIKTMKIMPNESGGLLSDRDAKIIDESRREVATLVDRWKKTKNKLLALVDYKEQYESPISDKKNQSRIKSSHHRIKELLEATNKDSSKKNGIVTIPSDIRRKMVEAILRYERKRFIIGDYSTYRLEKAYYSPSKPKMKKASTIIDASKWLKSESPVKGKKKKVVKNVDEEAEKYEEVAEPPQFPTWKYYSGLDEENFYDQLTMAFQETKIREASKNDTFDLFC